MQKSVDKNERFSTEFDYFSVEILYARAISKA